MEHVFLDRYEVEYCRTDGRNMEGVDVPYRITGPLRGTCTSPRTRGGRGVRGHHVVSHLAKFEPPLSNLVGFNVAGSSPTDPFVVPGQGIITTIAEITIHGRTIKEGWRSGRAG